jgi:hypothetical protein
VIVTNTYINRKAASAKSLMNPQNCRIRAFWQSQACEIEYDVSSGVEVLVLQLISAHEIADQETLKLIDCFGVEIESTEQLSDKIVRLGLGAALDVWCLPADIRIQDSSFMCTQVLLPESELIQPVCYVIDTPFRICQYCSKHVFHPSIQSSHGAPGLQVLMPFICDSGKAVDFGLALDGANAIRISLADDIKAKYLTDPQSPIALFIRKQMYGMALKQQQASLSPQLVQNLSSAAAQFKGRLNSGVQTVMAYEDPQQKQAALESIDFKRVRQYADEYADEHPTSAKDVAFIHGLLRWFKADFFKWCNKPECSNAFCGARPGSMDSVGMAEPSPEERNLLWSGRVEAYRCKECNQMTRFPRINNPKELLKTRRGRCGEWANAFCLLCRALSLDARWVLDFTDHVWVEIFVPSLNSYVHADPCERSLDCPLMYEAGWNKKLSYLISFSRHGVADASTRYSRKWNEVMGRRTELPECLTQQEINAIDELRWSQFVAHASTPAGAGNSSSSSAAGLAIAETTHWDIVHQSDPMAGFNLLIANGDVGIQELTIRRAAMRSELYSFLLLDPSPVKSGELQGRSSGDRAWRLARGELGSAEAVEDVVATEIKQARKFKYSLATANDVPSWLRCVTADGAAPQVSDASAVAEESNVSSHVDVWLHSVGTWSRGDTMDYRLNSMHKTNIVGANKHGNSPFIAIQGRPVCAGGRGLHQVACEGSGAIKSIAVEDNELLELSAGTNYGGKSGVGFTVGSVVEHSESLTRQCASAMCATSVSDSDIDVSALTTVAGLRDNEDQTLAHVGFQLSNGENKSIHNFQVNVGASVSDKYKPHTIRARLLVRQPASSGHNHHYQNIPGHRCKTPVAAVFSDATEPASKKARVLCDANANYAGYLLVSSRAENKEEYALIFSEATGFPLQEADNDDPQFTNALHLKSVLSPQAAPESTIAVPVGSAANSLQTRSFVFGHVSLQYVPLGGGFHGDTATFDTTQFLFEQIQMFAKWFVSEGGSHTDYEYLCSLLLQSLRLRRITFNTQADGNMCTGVRCSYDVNVNGHSKQFDSSAFRSSDPSNLSVDFSVFGTAGNDDDKVSHICVRAGDLIDGILLRTRSGREFRAGGSGGSPNEVCLVTHCHPS